MLVFDFHRSCKNFPNSIRFKNSSNLEALTKVLGKALAKALGKVLAKALAKQMWGPSMK